MNWDVVLVVFIWCKRKTSKKKKKPEQIKWRADINPTVAILTQNVNKLKIQSKDMY